MPRLSHSRCHRSGASARASMMAVMCHAGVVQVDRGGVGTVVGGEDDRLPADCDAVAVQEGAGPVGEHDSGAVVVGEDDGALVRPGRDQDVAGPDTPYPLAAERGRGLRGRGGRCVVPPRGRTRRRSVRRRWCAAGAAHRDSWPARRPRPRPSPGPARRRWCRCCPAGRRPPHCARRRAPPGRRCAPRSAPRPGPPVRHRPPTDRCAYAWRRSGRNPRSRPADPARGDRGDQPVEQLDSGREQHRLGEGLLDLDQAAGVFGPGRGDAAGPAELDAGADLVDAVGQQCRGQGVAGVPGQFPAAEGEGCVAVAVDATTAGVRNGAFTDCPVSARPPGTRRGIGRWRCPERR